MTTQTDRILTALETRDCWHSMPKLARIASPKNNGAGIAVHSRVCDLRRRLKASGRTIVNDTEQRRDGSKSSFYRIAAL